jgi:hypothetical protein
LSSTGDITKKVRNSAKPINTWLGGDEGVPMAERNSDSTMMMRVKPVIINKMAGRKVSDEMRISVCRLRV